MPIRYCQVGGALGCQQTNLPIVRVAGVCKTTSTSSKSATELQRSQTEKRSLCYVTMTTLVLNAPVHFVEFRHLQMSFFVASYICVKESIE